MQLTALRRRYETELFERVLPFWERHSPDAANGGYFNCLDRDGSVYSPSKHVWLQGRQAWMFAKLYRTVEPRPEWLAMARSGVDFLRTHALRDDGRVYFQLAADGRPQALQRKIFGECFYAMALAEVGRASDSARLVREAEAVLDRLFVWADDWSHVGRVAYAGSEPLQMLAVPMILLNLVEEVGGETWQRYGDRVDGLLGRVMRHVHDDRRLVFENVRADGSLALDTPEGRLLNPGHAIEAGWFIRHWGERLGRPELVARADALVAWSHDAGWDAEHGGLFYFLDSEGHSPTQLEWPMKLWWPHCEALYAHLRAAIKSDDADVRAAAWRRFEATDTYAFTHFPDPEHGEWYGYLDRQGTVTHRFKGGPYKGCFHVPRALWLCWTLLKEAEESGAQTA